MQTKVINTKKNYTIRICRETQHGIYLSRLNKNLIQKSTTKQKIQSSNRMWKSSKNKNKHHRSRKLNIGKTKDEYLQTEKNKPWLTQKVKEKKHM